MDLSRIGGPKLSDQVAAQLQDRILQGELKPGDRLPTEAALGERLGVSRSVVRDAMRTLAARGLVTVRQGHGIEVSGPNDEALAEALVLQLMRSDATLGDIIDARATLEIALGPLAARYGNEEDWTRMRSSLDEFGGAVEREDWPRAHTEHLAFHEAMLDALHVPVLSTLLRPMHQLILLSSLPPRFDDAALWAVEAHEPILAALRARDEDGARSSLERHFDFRAERQYSELTLRLFRDAPTLNGHVSSAPSRR